jgi:hypothetical protein
MKRETLSSREQYIQGCFFSVCEETRSEEPFEFRQNIVLNVPSDVGKRTEDMHSGGWPRISEGYVAGKIELHLHFRLSEVEVADYTALSSRTLVIVTTVPGGLNWLKSATKGPRVPRLRQPWVTVRFVPPITGKLWCLSTRASSLRR